MSENKKADTKTKYTPTADDIVHKDGKVFIGANKKVTVVIPKEPGVKEQPPVYVNANGKTVLIEKGKPVKVNTSVADVLKEADRLRAVSDDYYAKVSN